jgi:hypothetical protein
MFMAFWRPQLGVAAMSRAITVLALLVALPAALAAKGGKMCSSAPVIPTFGVDRLPGSVTSMNFTWLNPLLPPLDATQEYTPIRNYMTVDVAVVQRFCAVSKIWGRA